MGMEFGNPVTRSKLPLFHIMPEPSYQLGNCPFCGSSISNNATILEYEVDGEERLYAECYECNEPVQPT